MNFIKITGHPSGDTYLIAVKRIISIRDYVSYRIIQVKQGEHVDNIQARTSLQEIEDQL